MKRRRKVRTTVYLWEDEAEAARKKLEERDSNLSAFFRACLRRLLKGEAKKT